MADEPRIVTDFDRLAADLIMMITNDRRVDIRLALRVSERLQWGPQVCIWPKDLAEASQRARDRARERNSVAPRPLTPPELPRPLAPPTLPRPLAPVAAPTLPRVLPPLPRP